MNRGQYTTLLFLIVVAGAIGFSSGIYQGAYDSEPVLSNVIDNQAVQIDDLKDSVSACKDNNENLQEQIDELDEEIDDLTRCYNAWNRSDKNTDDLYEFITCTGEVNI